MSPSQPRTVRPARRFGGTVRVPGDKSISHRALLLGALATGRTAVRGLAPGADCRSTMACLAALGVDIAGFSGAGDPAWLVEGRGLGGLAAPAGPLDAGNSGTTARFLMGVLSGHAFSATLIGDASLSRRPMRRVADPLERMGARVDTTGGCLPATVRGARLSGIAYQMPVASAQVKSAVLLAGLHADGVTAVVEPQQTRDHTERALAAFGADIAVGAGRVEVRGRRALRAADISVPGDPSSAAFWAAAAAGIPGAAVVLEGVGVNPTRTAFLGVIERMGAHVRVEGSDAPGGEPHGTVAVRHEALRAVEIRPSEVPGLIDELPALAALATYGGGLTVRGAGELRLKESDRIAALVAGLRALGAGVEEYPDGFCVSGDQPLSGGVADAAGDHRLAMAFAVAALGARGDSRICGAEAVAVSYPGFFDTLERLCG
ncbi:MAG: 3-phosphoshikimate 1-carboxyvinyltransferase [Vicinamibacterales bacterium]